MDSTEVPSTGAGCNRSRVGCARPVGGTPRRDRVRWACAAANARVRRQRGDLANGPARAVLVRTSRAAQRRRPGRPVRANWAARRVRAERAPKSTRERPFAHLARRSGTAPTSSQRRAQKKPESPRKGRLRAGLSRWQNRPDSQWVGRDSLATSSALAGERSRSPPVAPGMRTGSFGPSACRQRGRVPATSED